MGDRARLRHLRGAARRPRRRGGLHPAAEHDARRLVDPRARGGQARALREAAAAGTRPTSSGRSTPPSATGLPALGGVHVAPQPADGAARRARREGAIGELRLIRSAFSYALLRRRQHPPAHRRRGRRADGRRLLLRQRLAPARRRAGVGLGAAVHRARRAPTGSSPACCASRATSWRCFDCGTSLPHRDELEAIGTEGSLFLDDPWHCRAARDRAAARATASSGSSSSRRTPTGSSSRI